MKLARCTSLSIVAMGAILMADQTEFQTVHKDKFTVIGIECRTSNELELQSKGCIAGIVARVRKDGVLRKLPNRIGPNTYALYTNYKSDYHGPYTYFLGAEVTPGTRAPRGLVKREVPAGEYAMFTGAGSPAINVVLKLWQHIWSLEEAHQIDRAYKTDFEVHHGIDENNDPGGRVDVYIGLKR